MMARRTDYFLQIFKTIGAPLVGAALSRAQEGAGLDPKAIAQPVAELLTKSVQLGIDLGALVELEKQGEKSESARIAMTALAGDMLGGWFALQGKMPEPADMQRITEGLRTVKEFSATFEASPEATLRLETLKPKGQAVDALQSQMQLFTAFVPVIEALTSFPVGDDPKAAVQLIMPRLSEKVAALAAEITPDDPDKAAQRALMGCVASLYAQCHEAEGQAAQMQGRPLALDGVWARFDVQFDILEALTYSIVPSAVGAAVPVPPAAPPVQMPIEASAPPPASPEPPPAAPPPPPPVVEPPAQPAAEAPKPQIFSAPIQQPVEETPAPPAEPVVTPPAFTAPPAVEPPPAPPEPPPSVPPAAAAGNPMSFFSKKPDAADTPPANAPSVQEPAAPPPQQPIEPPPAAPPVEQTPPPPPTAPPAESNQAAANPMSFFTKKDSEEGDEE